MSQPHGSHDAAEGERAGEETADDKHSCQAGGGQWTIDHPQHEERDQACQQGQAATDEAQQAQTRSAFWFLCFAIDARFFIEPEEDGVGEHEQEE